jgi:hypothetical protein
VTRIGYGRAATRDQNPQAQEDALSAAASAIRYAARGVGGRPGPPSGSARLSESTREQSCGPPRADQCVRGEPVVSVGGGWRVVRRQLDRALQGGQENESDRRRDARFLRQAGPVKSPSQDDYGLQLIALNRAEQEQSTTTTST